jgi:hypothetical protein
MIAISYVQAVAISALFCSGAVLSACITTRTEALKRGMPPVSIGPFERIPFGAAAEAVLSASLSMILVAAMMLLVGLGIMYVGGIHGLDEKARLPFGLALLTGAAATKYARYLYWRSKG